jgi:thiol:disulfide interchange protein
VRHEVLRGQVIEAWRALPGPSVLIVALAACSPTQATPPTVLIGGGAPVSSAAPTASRTASPTSPKKEAGPIAWMESEPAARDRARRTKLPLIVWVRASWDAATMEMERKVWTDPRVLEAARPFVALRLDVTDTDGYAERYAEQYEVRGVPTIVLYDARGRRVDAFIGSRDPADLVAALRRVAEE